MSEDKYNSLRNIFRGFLIEDQDDEDYQFYDVGERTIYVLHEMLNERLVQMELEAIESMLDAGGFSGAYRVELDVLDECLENVETRVYDLYLIKIPHCHSDNSSEAKQR